MTKHMMIDLETFGVGERAAIVQMGVCVFDPRPGPPSVVWTRQWNIHLKSSIALGGEIDEDALMWWMKQSEEARMSVSAPNLGILEAISNLKGLYHIHGCEAVWSHGSCFDIAILNGYYRRAGMESPWPYHAVRDTRTLYDLADYRPSRVVAHTAMADAVAQARDVQAAYELLAMRERSGPA
jgi:hypothetical protein